jgi:hypothetical protein
VNYIITVTPARVTPQMIKDMKIDTSLTKFGNVIGIIRASVYNKSDGVEDRFVGNNTYNLQAFLNYYDTKEIITDGKKEAEGAESANEFDKIDG